MVLRFRPPHLSKVARNTHQKHGKSTRTHSHPERSSGSFDVKLLDGAAVVHLLPCTNIVTFDEYADHVLVPYIIKQLEHSKRVDVVWETYIISSIKEGPREKRGKGIWRKVAGKNKLPGNWADFFHDPTNK